MKLWPAVKVAEIWIFLLTNIGHMSEFWHNFSVISEFILVIITIAYSMILALV